MRLAVGDRAEERIPKLNFPFPVRLIGLLTVLSSLLFFGWLFTYRRAKGQAEGGNRNDGKAAIQHQIIDSQ